MKKKHQKRAINRVSRREISPKWDDLAKPSADQGAAHHHGGRKKQSYTSFWTRALWTCCV